MRTRDYLLRAWLSVLFVLVLGFVFYIPILLAWSNRQMSTHWDEPSAHLNVQYNWPMRIAPSIYEPLLEWHAWVAGQWARGGVQYIDHTAMGFRGPRPIPRLGEKPSKTIP